MTPGAPSPGGYNPHTPGSGIEQSSSDWVTTDIQVKVRDTYLDSQAVGQTGVIRSVTVSPRWYRVWGGDRTVTNLNTDSLFSPSPPAGWNVLCVPEGQRESGEHLQ